MNFFYRKDVLLHNKKDDCWIIIRNSVYDITGFIAAHPGGMDILLARAGEDATSYFITKHSKSKSVFNHLEKLKIGELIERERITANDFDEPFLMELIDRCYSHKLYQTSAWYRNNYFWVRSVNVLSFFVLSFFTLYMKAPLYLTVIAIILQAIIGTSLFGLLAHEDTHRDFTKNRFLDLLLTISWPLFWPFISRNPLKYEHNSHHIKIGDPEFDYEVAAFEKFIRYSGYIDYSPSYANQNRLAKYFYPFYANIITTVGGIRSGFWHRHNRSVSGEHVISVLTSISYFIILPTLVNGSLLLHVGLYMIYQCVLFYGIYVGAAINHFVPTATAPIPEEYENKYGYYICHNTTNFCISSPFWFWYTGGFNVQIEHHLIPFIPVENLRKMMPIVQELCKKYKYPYRNYRSFLQLWNDHYKYLSILSNPAQSKEIETEIANKNSYQGR